VFFESPRNLASRTLAYPREAFDAVNMDIAFAVTFLVINPVVFLITKMHNRILRPETIGINSRIKAHFTLDNCLQSLGLDVFDNLSIDTSVTFVDTENARVCFPLRFERLPFLWREPK